MTPLECRYAMPLAASSRRDSSLACTTAAGRQEHECEWQHIHTGGYTPVLYWIGLLWSLLRPSQPVKTQ